MRQRSFLALALAAGLAAGPAGAATYVGNAANGLVALRTYNLITLGNLNENSEVEGKAFVGGNLNGACGSIGCKVGTPGAKAQFGVGRTSSTSNNVTTNIKPEATSSAPTLTVAGNTTTDIYLMNGANGPNAKVAGQLSMQVGGSMSNVTSNTNIDDSITKVGGNISLAGGANTPGNVNNNSKATSITYGGTYGGGSANGVITRDATLGANGTNDLASALATAAGQMGADLKSLSSTLAAATINSSYTISGAKITFDFSKIAPASQYAVVNISANALFSSSLNDLVTINLAKDSNGNYITGVINVIGDGTTDYTYYANNNYVGDVAQNVIFNFVNVKDVTLTSAFGGTILAPGTTLMNSTAITGTVVADVFNQNGEVHLGNYANASSLGIPTAVAAVPEVGTWAMMVLGFGTIGGVLRVRRRPGRIDAIV